jgi:hypothetical protein
MQVGIRARRPAEKRDPVSDRRYVKPPWMQRHVGNRISVLFKPSMISKLSVRGRRSGRWHTTPIAVLEHKPRSTCSNRSSMGSSPRRGRDRGAREQDVVVLGSTSVVHALAGV